MAIRLGKRKWKCGDEGWAGDFQFAVIADPQFGMLKDNKSWGEEKGMLVKAISHLNHIRPKYVVVVGDLVHAYPDTFPEKHNAQVRDVKACFKKLHTSIPVFWLCGNHDVGNTPDETSMKNYNSNFGEDYYTFTSNGVRNIVFNSSFYKDSSQCENIAKKHGRWLVKELEIAKALNDPRAPWAGRLRRPSERKSTKPAHTMMFCHIPPFIYQPNEENGYFNYPEDIRTPLLTHIKDAGVAKLFCGHFHGNAGGYDENLEVVITSAIGSHLTRTGVDPLGLKGIENVQCTEETSGLRIVSVTKRNITHKFINISSLAESGPSSGKETKRAPTPANIM